MLIIESVNPTGMFSFGDCQDIDLRGQGLVNLLGVNRDQHGDSNGSGKSSLFNSVCEVLYQENPTRVSGDSVINNVWARGFSGRVTFLAWEQIKYRVTYCRKWKAPVYESDNDNRAEYTGTTLFFDKFVNGVWVDCRAEGMKPTLKAIQTALGLTYDQFLAVAYMTPRQGNILLRGANKDRMDVLSGLVGLDVWDTLLDNLKGEKRQRLQTQADLEKQVAYLDGELNQLKAQVASTSLNTVQADIAEAQEKLKEVQNLQAVDQENLKALNNKLVGAQHKRDELKAGATDSYQDQIESVLAQIADLKVERANCRTSINPELATEFNTADMALNRVRGALSAVKGDNNLVDVENCPTCGTRITKTARTQMEKKIKAAEKDVAEWENRVLTIRMSVEQDRASQETEIAHRQRDVDKQIQALEVQKAQAIDARSAQMVKHNELDTQVNTVQNEISQVHVHSATCDQAATNWLMRINDLGKAITAVKALETAVEAKQVDCTTKQEECKAVVQEIAHYTWFTVNIPFIKLHKLSVALNDLSDLANGYLQKMGDTASIVVSSFKAKKKATSELQIDQLKGEISVTIVDGLKNIDPRLYSDGETARFSTALVRAMHDLALKYGQGCNLVLLDEIFSFVDGNNSQKIADSFASDLQPGSTCVVTDNSGAAANLMDFDKTWTVVKENGLSQIVLEG